MPHLPQVTALVLSMLSAVSNLDTFQALLVLRLSCIGALAFATGEACMLRSVCSCFTLKPCILPPAMRAGRAGTLWLQPLCLSLRLASWRWVGQGWLTRLPLCFPYQRLTAAGTPSARQHASCCCRRRRCPTVAGAAAGGLCQFPAARWQQQQLTGQSTCPHPSGQHPPKGLSAGSSAAPPPMALR